MHVHAIFIPSFDGRVSCGIKWKQGDPISNDLELLEL